MKIDLHLKDIEYLGNKMRVPKWVCKATTDRDGAIYGYSKQATPETIPECNCWVLSKHGKRTKVYVMVLSHITDEVGNFLNCPDWKETLREV